MGDICNVEYCSRVVCILAQYSALCMYVCIYCVYVSVRPENLRLNYTLNLQSDVCSVCLVEAEVDRF